MMGKQRDSSNEAARNCVRVERRRLPDIHAGSSGYWQSQFEVWMGDPAEIEGQASEEAGVNARMLDSYAG